MRRYAQSFLLGFTGLFLLASPAQAIPTAASPAPANSAQPTTTTKAGDTQGTTPDDAQPVAPENIQPDTPTTTRTSASRRSAEPHPNFPYVLRHSRNQVRNATRVAEFAAFRASAHLRERPRPTSTLRLMLGSEHAFALADARQHHRDWHYFDVGLAMRTPGVRMELRTQAPILLADAIIGGIQFLATGKSRPPPLLGLLNGDLEDPVGTTMFQGRGLGAIRHTSQRATLIGGEYRMVLGGRVIPTTDAPDELPASVRAETRAGWLMQQLGVIAGHEWQAGHVYLAPALQLGNGISNLAPWNPFAAAELSVEADLRRWALYGRLRGQVQRIDYRGYSSTNPVEREAQNITLRTWHPSIILQLGVGFGGAL